MKVVIATANRHKFDEISEILLNAVTESPIKPTAAGKPELILGGEIVAVAPEETGDTFFENALIKAKYYWQNTGIMSVADDSGLIVDALDGAPGIYSSRFAGEHCSFADNIEKLLAALSGVPTGKRTARFFCSAVVYSGGSDETIIEATGTLEGSIGFERRGTGGFGYDPVFVLPGGGTLAELSSAQKSEISHRAIAFKKIARQLLHYS
jgi:XTP/dITP diphosphohydrolase